MTADTLRLSWNVVDRLAAKRGARDAATRGKPAAGSWAALRPATKIYVGMVAGFGAIAIVSAIPQLQEVNSGIFTALAILSLITAFAKVNVAASGGVSTLTVCYVIDFTALVALGIPYATLTTAAGVWAQCTFKTRAASRLYQTWFSIGALAVTVQIAVHAYRMLGGQVGMPQPVANPAALVAAGAAYFLANSLLIAGAVAMSSGQSLLRVWWRSYAPMWRGYLVGFAIASFTAAGIARSTLWLIPLAFSVVALTSRNLKTYADGLTDSNTDALTDLPNRRCLTTRVSQELTRAERDRGALAVVVLDLDNFKFINDTYGHHAGDAVLRSVARRLQGSLRNYDICARYGGDEFVVLLPGCGGADALHKAETLRRAVEDAACEIKPGMTVPIEVSVGAAAFPAEGRTFDALFAAADRRMYDDKAARRSA